MPEASAPDALASMVAGAAAVVPTAATMATGMATTGAVVTSTPAVAATTNMVAGAGAVMTSATMVTAAATATTVTAAAAVEDRRGASAGDECPQRGRAEEQRRPPRGCLRGRRCSPPLPSGDRAGPTQFAACNMRHNSEGERGMAITGVD